MAKAKKDDKPVINNEAVVADNPDVLEADKPQSVLPADTNPHPSLPVDQSKDMPNFEGDAKQDYVDINDPKQGNKTYVQLQNGK